MGWKHVVPQFILRALAARDCGDNRFEIQSDGTETRAFAYVDDVVDGIVLMQREGANREVYHIGNDHEVSIRDLVAETARVVGTDLQIVPGVAATGGTPRRCPDISKMRALGYAPSVDLQTGMARTGAWYTEHRGETPDNALM